MLYLNFWDTFVVPSNNIADDFYLSVPRKYFHPKIELDVKIARSFNLIFLFSLSLHNNWEEVFFVYIQKINEQNS